MLFTVLEHEDRICAESNNGTALQAGGVKKKAFRGHGYGTAAVCAPDNASSRNGTQPNPPALLTAPANSASHLQRISALRLQPGGSLITALIRWAYKHVTLTTPDEIYDLTLG